MYLGAANPSTGEINYPWIARALVAMDYRGPIGMEAFAKGDPEDAIEAFRLAFKPTT